MFRALDDETVIQLGIQSGVNTRREVGWIIARESNAGAADGN